jgi:hypothetical protein
MPPYPVSELLTINKKPPMQSIIRIIPPWLRARLIRPAQQKPSVTSKKERQPLPVLPKPEQPVNPTDEYRYRGIEMLWRL